MATTSHRPPEASTKPDDGSSSRSLLVRISFVIVLMGAGAIVAALLANAMTERFDSTAVVALAEGVDAGALFSEGSPTDFIGTDGQELNVGPDGASLRFVASALTAADAARTADAAAQAFVDAADQRVLGISERAPLPTAAASPNRPLIVGIGLLAGALLGLLLQGALRPTKRDESYIPSWTQPEVADAAPTDDALVGLRSPWAAAIDTENPSASSPAPEPSQIVLARPSTAKATAPAVAPDASDTPRQPAEAPAIAIPDTTAERSGGGAFSDSAFSSSASGAPTPRTAPRPKPKPKNEQAEPSADEQVPAASESAIWSDGESSAEPDAAIADDPGGDNDDLTNEDAELDDNIADQTRRQPTEAEMPSNHTATDGDATDRDATELAVAEASTTKDSTTEAGTTKDSTTEPDDQRADAAPFRRLILDERQRASEERSRISSSHATQIAELQSELDRQQDELDVTVRTRDQARSLLEDKVQELEIQLAARTDELQRQRAALAAASDRQPTEDEGTASELSFLRIEVDRYQQSLADERVEHATALAATRLENQDELDEIHRQHRITLNQLAQTNRNLLTSQRNDAERLMAGLETRHQRALDRAHDEYEDRLRRDREHQQERLRGTESRVRTDVERELSDEMSELRDQVAKSAESERDAESKLADATNEAEQADRRATEAHAEADRAVRRNTDELATLRNRNNELEQRLDRAEHRLAEERKRTSEVVRNLLQESASAAQAADWARQSQVADHSSTTAELQERVQALTSQLQILQQSTARRETELEATIASLRARAGQIDRS